MYIVNGYVSYFSTISHLCCTGRGNITTHRKPRTCLMLTANCIT